MKNIGGDSHSKFEANLRGISLADAKRMVGSAASTGPAAIAGTLDATATASWGKSFDDLVAHTDATIRAGLANAQNTKRVAAPAASPAAASNVTPSTGPIPVQRRTACDLHR